MVVGVHGDCGANVLKHVVQAHNIARVPVLNPVRDMEENPAQDQTSRPGSAIQDSVPFTVVGPVGLCGAHAREPVGMAGSIVEDIAPILFPNMEEEDATDPALGHVLATSKHAQ